MVSNPQGTRARGPATRHPTQLPTPEAVESMGNFDKLVSLTVLFLVAIVLGVTLNSPPDDESDSGDPLAGVRAGLGDAMQEGGEGEEGEQLAMAPGAMAPVAMAPSAGERAGSGNRPSLNQPGGSPSRSERPLEQRGGEQDDPALLSAGVQTPGGPSSAGQEGGQSEEPQRPDPVDALPQSDPLTGAPRILRTLDSLEETFSDDYRVYRWRSNDTWRLVSQRYYGDPAFASLLRAQNEDSARPAAQQAVLLPVYDLSRSYGPAHGGGGSANNSGRRAEVARASVAKASHEVRDGESLWSIAQKHLGAGSRWQELHEANLDLIPNPDDLQPGMVLVLPE